MAVARPMAAGWTVGDVERLPEDGIVRHLVAGELFEMTPPTLRHQSVVTEITWRFRSYAEEHGGKVFTAPTGVRLSDEDMPEPDVLFVSAAHMDRLGERYVEGPPDLVVEVSSPSTRRLDLMGKRRQYERFGVSEFWFVDLDADRVEVYRLTDGGYGSPSIVGVGGTVEAVSIAGLTIAVDAIVGT